MYVGHTTEDGRRQPLSQHLHKVAALCRRFAEPFGAGDVAHAIGLCHDLGKYSEKAQKRLLQNGPPVDHSTAGGLEAHRLCGFFGSYCVFGHHGGLPDGGSPGDKWDNPSWFGRQKRRVGQGIEDYTAFRPEIALQQPQFPAFRPLGDAGFSCAMLVRMLFSCLVDADFLDTEEFMSDGKVERGGYETIDVLHEKLLHYIQPFFHPTSELNRKRSEILQSCIEKANGPKGLYSLTVPTGGGKTISSLAFALGHARKHGMRRVIYVIPYTSIIEQNAAVFADILGAGNVLEHHSGYEYDNATDDQQQKKLYLSTENWDAPVVVTTNVQFFESLFSSKTSKCRKLHNIAGSVVIFDEAQMLPTRYLTACVRGIAELVHNYGCTAVLCSATQPALDGLFPPEIQREEICPDPPALYRFFCRTTVQNLGALTDEALAAQLNALPQALCIVSTRKQAQRLYQMLEAEGSFHLSTMMYPEHRKRVLAEIRARLSRGLPCRVVSTSLIEAGVDVDFPVVYRAKAGLDSIVQAAGRCNREGKHPAGQSFVYVFEPESGYTLPVLMRQPAAVFELAAAKHSEDITSLEAIHTYFERLYDIKGAGLDEKRIVARLEAGYREERSFPFKTIGEEFRLIESNTHAILIPDGPEAAALAERLRQGERGHRLLRQAGRYSVQVYDHHYQELVELGLVAQLDDGVLSILSVMSSYSDQTGLNLSPQGGKAIFIDV